MMIKSIGLKLSFGSSKLWTNDCWWMDVYWATRYRTWNLQYLVECRKTKVGIPQDGDLQGHLFVVLIRGMSAAQAKAIEIANGVGIIAEVDLF